MSELDQLAAAASGSAQRPYPIHRAPQKPNRTVWIAVAGAAAIVVVVALTLLLKSQGVLRSDRQFAVQFHDDSGQLGWWEVTNEGDAALRISKVTVNGEFVCKPASGGGSYAAYQSDGAYPVTATIGETRSFVQYRLAPITSAQQVFQPMRLLGYTKNAVYVDFQTNRGTFRYRVEGGWE